MSAPTIHIHEDDWGMRNLYPVAAFAVAQADVAEASDAGRRNRQPNGLGWSKVHLIKPPAVDYADVGLELAPTAERLESLMPRIRQFTATATAGFDPAIKDAGGSYETDAQCFGFGSDCYIKLETKGDLVRQIWFDVFTDDTTHLEAFRHGVLSIDALAPSLIADYREDVVGSIRDDAFFARYMRTLAGEDS